MTQEGSRAEKLAVPPLLEADTFLGLTTTFLNAVNAFNRQEVRKIEEALADNAILYKVTNGTPVSGKAAIIGYLEAKVMQDKPVFVPVTISLHPPSSTDIPARCRLLEKQRQASSEHTPGSLRISFPVSCSIPDHVDVGDSWLIRDDGVVGLVQVPAGQRHRRRTHSENVRANL